MSENTAGRTVEALAFGEEIEHTQISNPVEKRSPSKRGKPQAPKEVKLIKVKQDRSRDALLTDFGKKTLVDRYLLPEESYQDMFARVSEALSLIHI